MRAMTAEKAPEGRIPKKLPKVMGRPYSRSVSAVKIPFCWLLVAPILVSVARNRLFFSVRILTKIKSETQERAATALAILMMPDAISLKNCWSEAIVIRLSPPSASIPKVGLDATNALSEKTKDTKNEITNIDTRTAIAWKRLVLASFLILAKVI